MIDVDRETKMQTHKPSYSLGVYPQANGEEGFSAKELQHHATYFIECLLTVRFYSIKFI